MFNMANKTSNTQPIIASPLMSALHRRKLILKDIPHRSHSLTAYSLLHQRLAREISTAIEKIEAEEERRKFYVGGSSSFHQP
jgi:hypothetical protein